LCSLAALLFAPAGWADESVAEAKIVESPEAKNERMEWWRDARFGMFIHWGVYSVPAGFWDGKPTNNVGEWIMNTVPISREDYTPLAKEFNPTNYDPVAWARLAKQAGMKYLVITSKHHDGFCLFDTKATDWDVVDATPYGKDLLKPLAEACRAEGIEFCVYYSIMDWHHPSQNGAATPWVMDPNRKGEYVAYMKAQLKELIDSCNPQVLWFDGEWVDWWTEEDGRDLYAYLRGLKPDLIVNNRVGKGRQGMQGFNKSDAEYVGDFGTPEQEIPAQGVPGVDWESCMTMNNTWGFRKDDHNWKSTETLVRNLVDIASKGGNYLLNVGPTADGEIPAASVERLEQIGTWMERNGESIYGTSASPFEQPEWGRFTKRTEGGTTTLYLHVFSRPADGKITVPAQLAPGVSAKFLANGESLQTNSVGDGVEIILPENLPDAIDSVIVLETGAAENSSSTPRSGPSLGE
jgi:alpha-L-fucosidase